MLVDWRKREWYLSDSNDIMGYFRRWLEDLPLGEEAAHPPMLEHEEDFLAGTLHLNPDSDTGVDEQFEHPPTEYDTNDHYGVSHLHESALGFMYNWQEKAAQ